MFLLRILQFNDAVRNINNYARRIVYRAGAIWSEAGVNLIEWQLYKPERNN